MVGDVQTILETHAGAQRAGVQALTWPTSGWCIKTHGGLIYVKSKLQSKVASIAAGIEIGTGAEALTWSCTLILKSLDSNELSQVLVTRCEIAGRRKHYSSLELSAASTLRDSGTTWSEK